MELRPQDDTFRNTLVESLGEWIKLVLASSKIIEGEITHIGKDYLVIKGNEEIRDKEQSHLYEVKSVVLAIPIDQVSFTAEYPEK